MASLQIQIRRAQLDLGRRSLQQQQQQQQRTTPATTTTTTTAAAAAEDKKDESISSSSSSSPEVTREQVLRMLHGFFFSDKDNYVAAAASRFLDCAAITKVDMFYVAYMYYSFPFDDPPSGPAWSFASNRPIWASDDNNFYD